MDVLEHCKTTGIEAVLVQAQLYWSRHLVRMSDTRLPSYKTEANNWLKMARQNSFYSQLASENGPCGHPVKWYKDELKKTYSCATSTQRPGKQLHKIDRCGEAPASREYPISNINASQTCNWREKKRKAGVTTTSLSHNCSLPSVDVDVLPPSDSTRTWELTSADCSSVSSTRDSNN